MACPAEKSGKVAPSGAYARFIFGILRRLSATQTSSTWPGCQKFAPLLPVATVKLDAAGL